MKNYKRFCVCTALFVIPSIAQAADEPPKPAPQHARIVVIDAESRLRPVGEDPQKQKIQLGDIAMLKAESPGATAYKWAVRPNVAGLMVTESGKGCLFSNRKPGEYTIILAAAGPAGVDVTLFELEITAPAPPAMPQPVAEPVARAQPVAPKRTAAPPMRAPEPEVEEEETLPELIARYVSEIPGKSNQQRLTEARVVGGCFRAVASSMKTGTLAAGSDPFVDVQRQAVQALGGAYGSWKEFFVKLSPEMAAETVSERIVLYAGVGTVLAGLRQ